MMRMENYVLSFDTVTVQFFHRAYSDIILIDFIGILSSFSFS